MNIPIQAARRSTRMTRGGRRCAAAVASARPQIDEIEALEVRRLFSVPDGPFALTATPIASTQASLHWYNSSTDASGIHVLRRGADGVWQTVATLGPAATTYLDGGLSAGGSYEFVVQAFNDSGDSGAVAAGPITTPFSTADILPPTAAGTIVPDGPFALSANADFSTQVTLNWYDSDRTGANYRVMRSTPGGNWQPIGYLGPNATTFTDGTVSPGTTYNYQVCAYNVVGDSGFTNVGTVTTPGPGGVGAGGGTGGGSSANPAGYFPVGVFYQPTYNFATWSSRGVNLLFGYEKGTGQSMDQWDAAAASYGFKEIRQPAANPAADGSMPNLLGWLAPQDEPDLNGTDPGAMTAQYAYLKAINPNLPVMTNFAGGVLLGMQGGTSASAYQQFLANTDLASTDIYPVTGWGLPDQVGLVGRAVDKLKGYASGKQTYAFVETSNQQLSWVPNDTGVTPDQFRGEVWDAVIHGASGIVYFSQQFGSGFVFDATPPAVAAEMIAQDARLQHFGAALLSAPNPGGVSVSVTSPLEATWRVYNGHTYLFVLNLSNQTLSGQTIGLWGVASGATLKVDGENRTVQVNGGAITDSFVPYAMHVYVA